MREPQIRVVVGERAEQMSSQRVCLIAVPLRSTTAGISPRVGQGQSLPRNPSRPRREWVVSRWGQPVP